MTNIYSIRKGLFTCTLFFTVLFFAVLVQANETGPDYCGEFITITGSTNHSGNPADYTVENATNNEFYKDEIWGADFTASISNLPSGDYTLKVYMAESYHSAASQRSFNVYVEDSLIIEGLDLFAEVGKDSEYLLSHVFTFSPGDDDTDLQIRFKKIIDNAKFNAIEVYDSENALVVCGMAHEFVGEIEPIGGGNPFIQHMYTADPSAHVFEDKVYVYPSHDQHNANGFNMRDYHVFSSTDMKNWEDHGVALDVDSVPWAKEYMWAPDCAFLNGTYYFYFPARDHAGEFKIGVATSTSPSGPFKAEPEPIEGSFSVDPAVFIDDDGEAYMYFGGDGDGGQKTPWVARLDTSMKQFAEEPVALTGIDYWFEACWINKVGDTYFLSYSTGMYHPSYPNSSALAYATSDNPYGPFKYQGVVNGYVSGWTNHHSIVDFKGQSYLFYHTSDLSRGATNKRSICADYLHFTEGEIKQVVQTRQGVGSSDGTKQIEAENYSSTSDKIVKQNDDDQIWIRLASGDTAIFDSVYFGSKNLAYLHCRVTFEGSGGIVEIRTLDGKLLGAIELETTGEDQSWNTLSTTIEGVSGQENIVLTYKGNDDNPVNIDWFKFSNEDLTHQPSIEGTPGTCLVYPNPVSGSDFTIEFEELASKIDVAIYNLSGANVYEQQISALSSTYSISNVELQTGMYILKVTAVLNSSETVIHSLPIEIL